MISNMIKKNYVLGRIVQINPNDCIKKHMKYFKYIKFNTKVRTQKCDRNRSLGQDLWSMLRQDCGRILEQGSRSISEKGVEVFQYHGRDRYQVWVSGPGVGGSKSIFEVGSSFRMKVMVGFQDQLTLGIGMRGLGIGVGFRYRGQVQGLESDFEWGLGREFDPNSSPES